MFDKINFGLPSEERKGLYYRTRKIKSLSREIASLVEQIKQKKINIKDIFLIPEDYKLDTDIEVENPDIMIQSIKDSTYPQSEKMRYMNLYLGMKYILEERNITEENLRNLYEIISKNIISFEEQGMQELYRSTREFVCHSHPVFPEYTEAVQPEHIKAFMDSFFEYITGDNQKSEIDMFIKSQLMHLYFVYVHPYTDGNGRSARLVSSWYLLNNQLDPYLLFNKAITNNRYEYNKAVQKSMDSKDMTHYLYFIMRELKKELEHVMIIEDMNNKLDVSLSKVERQIIEILLSLQETSLKQLVNVYTLYNPQANTEDIIKHRVIPLIEKGIIEEENGIIRVRQQEIHKKQYGG